MEAHKWIVLLALVALVFADSAEAGRKRKRKAKNADSFTYPGPFFSIPVTVGSQKTKLRVGIDGYYGSSIIYGKGVVTHDTFDHMKSSSFKRHSPGRHFEVSLGTADGPSGSDDIKVGSLKVKQAMFGVPQSIASYLGRKTQLSGFFAMNAPEMQQSEKTTMQIVAEKASDPKITFYAPTDKEGDHTVTIGQEDTSNCKTNWIVFNNMKSVDPNHKPWTIRWNGFKLGSYSKRERMNVAMNPAADYFVAPKRHANYFYKTLGATYSSTYHGGMIPCSKMGSLPNLEFTVQGGKKLKVTPKEYIKQFDSNNCLLNIYPDDLDQWTMPYMFHQRYCVKYDYGKKTVSIADPMSM